MSGRKACAGVRIASPAGATAAMTKYPRKDRYARTGSSLRGQPLLAHREARLKQDARRHGRLAMRDFRRRITAVPDLSGTRMMLSGLSAKKASTAATTPGHAPLP